jgi:hypothetical protein
LRPSTARTVTVMNCRYVFASRNTNRSSPSLVVILSFHASRPSGFSRPTTVILFPFFSASTSGPSMSAWSAIPLRSSADISCGSVSPENGMMTHAVFPSYAWMAVWPSTVNSHRTFDGRSNSRTVGAEDSSPSDIVPVIRSDRMAWSFSSPPRASTFFLTSSSAVGFPASAPRASTAAATDSTDNMRISSCGLYRSSRDIRAL